MNKTTIKPMKTDKPKATIFLPVGQPAIAQRVTHLLAVLLQLEAFLFWSVSLSLQNCGRWDYC